MAYRQLHKHRQLSGATVEEVGCCVAGDAEEGPDVFAIESCLSECQCEGVRICTTCYSQALIKNIQDECGDQLAR